MEKIRLANEEEVKSIVDKGSNLNSRSTVWQLEGMLGVCKVVNELDPIYLNGASTRQFCKFVWGLEYIMKGAGWDSYYFNVPVENEEYNKLILDFGGEKVSKQPDFRYKVTL